MNVIAEIQRINEAELQNGSVGTPASWHAKYADSAWVYVGNLPLQLTEGDVMCVMSQYGEVEDINLVREEDTGKSHGFAFLKYEDARSCVLAVDNFTGSKILGRSIRVDHVEKYRLPKHLAEKGNDQEEKGDSGDTERAVPGHAYRGKELASSYDIKSGQDLFAAPAPQEEENTRDLARRSGDTDGTSKDERREAKRARKEARDNKRKEKEERRMRKEERRREKRAKQMREGGGSEYDDGKVRRKRDRSRSSSQSSSPSSRRRHPQEKGDKKLR